RGLARVGDGCAEADHRVLATRLRLLAGHPQFGALQEAAPRACPGIPAVDLGEADLPVQPAELAVGDDREPDLLFALDHLPYRVVLRAFECFPRQLARAECAQRLLQRFRAQQAADVVDTKAREALETGGRGVHEKASSWSGRG